MHSFARKLFTRQIRSLKWRERKFSISSAAVKRGDEYIVRSPLSDIAVPDMSLADRLWSDSDTFLDNVAIECAVTRKRYSYRQLRHLTSVFATALHQKLGLKVGDMVAVMAPNCPEFPVVALGTMEAGCVLTTVNPIYKEYEVSHQTSLTQPKVIVTIQECYDIVVNGLRDAKVEAKIVIIDNPSDSVPSGAIRYSEIVEKGDADYDMLAKIVRSNEDVACIPFSSGTTGLPKGVEITYKILLAGFEMMGHERVCYPKLTTESFQDVVPCVLPLYHVYGLVITLLGHLTKGCKLVTMPKFSASLFLDMLKDYKASLLYAVPPIILLLSKHPGVTWDHLQHVRHISNGAAPLSASDVEPLLDKCKGQIQIGQGFGTTETAALTTSSLIGDKVDYSSCGVPMSNMEMMFVDTLTGDPVPIGKEGELYIRGPSVMKGYHKNEKATRDSITEDGFYKTGDLGYYKPGVGLYISDRIKELIKVKGLQVAPAELESVLRSHPAVADAAVVGVQHPMYGETPKAFIISKSGCKLTADDIRQFVASKVAAYKKIEQVQFVDQIPKTGSGKILRRDLKRMYPSSPSS